MKITAEMVREAYIRKGIKPVQNKFNLTIDWNAEGGPEFKCIDNCGCAVSVLVHGEKLTENAITACTGVDAAAETQLGINSVWDGQGWVQGDYFSYYENFDSPNAPIWEAVKDLA